MNGNSLIKIEIKQFYHHIAVYFKWRNLKAEHEGICGVHPPPPPLNKFTTTEYNSAENHILIAKFENSNKLHLESFSLADVYNEE